MVYPLMVGNCDFRILCAKFISTSVSLSPLIIASSSNFLSGFFRWRINNFFHCNIIVHHRFGRVSIGLAVFTYSTTSLIIIHSYQGKERWGFIPTSVVWLRPVFHHNFYTSSSTTLIDLSKENVIVVHNAAQIEVSVFQFTKFLG